MVNIHILLVDDEKDVLFLFKQQFKKWIRDQSINLSFSLSGQEALDYLASASGTDVILLLSDINMPGIDGFELLNQVQRDYPKIISILISGYSSNDYKDKASEIGAIDYFEKPVDFDRLKLVIKENFPELE